MSIILPNITYRPVLFYCLVFLISWSCWFISAYMSYQIDHIVLTILFAFAGLLGPMVAAIMMIFFDANNLFDDYKRRFANLNNISWFAMLLMISIIFTTLFVAVFISLLFGFPAEQLTISRFLLSMLPFALIAATFEELGWRSYGIDCLLAHRCLFVASCYFALLWGIWHVPLFFINQTYQHGLYELGPIYIINFFISIFPATIFANWLYYRCKRNIVAIILFHFMLVISAELLQIEPETKFIITLILLIISMLLIYLERKIFFSRLTLSQHSLL